MSSAVTGAREGGVSLKDPSLVVGVVGESISTGLDQLYEGFGEGEHICF